MANTKPVTVANVVRQAGPLSIPSGMSYRDASALLARKAQEDEQVISFHRTFPKVLPWDGAYVLQRVLDSLFSNLATVQGKTIQTPFGPMQERPETISVPSGPNGESTDIPWGTYYLPHDVSLTAESAFDKKSRMHFFAISAEGQRQYMPMVEEILSKFQAALSTDSLYRGKAIRVEFTDSNGDPLDEVKIDFVDLSHFSDEQAIFSRDISEEINALVYGPMSSPDPQKVGVLLSGIPGVGKTLVLSIAAHRAQTAGRTVIYCNSRDFTTTIRFAMNYEGPSGSVVVCEDVDRILSGERNASIDAIYNALDGPDTKHSAVSVLLTTNDLSVIPDPFLRPGRVRQTLELTPPDADAVLRLLAYYGAGKTDLPSLDSLRPVAARLSGRIPATIADVVARALDFAKYAGRTKATLLDLEVAERSMTKQLNLLENRNRIPKAQHPTVKAAKILARAISPSGGNGHASLPVTVLPPLALAADSEA